MLDFLKAAGFPAIALLIGGGMVLLAIIKNIALEKVKVQLTAQQSIQVAIVGALFIIGGIVLQYFPPNGSSNDKANQPEVNSTVSFLQTQLAELTSLALTTEQVSADSSATGTVTPSQPFSTAQPGSGANTQIPPAPTATTVVQSLAELYCTNFYSLRVREGPSENYQVHSIIENPNNLSNPDCLLFDYRMPDNSWIRIAPDQENANYVQHELGWVPAEQFRPVDFEKLRIYIPENVQNGLYCVTSRYGLKVRSCPNDGCREIGTISLQDCLILDGRSPDGQWVKISKEQNDDKYLPFSESWVSSFYLAPFEFAAGYQPYFRYYFELLPAIDLMPTPQG